MATAYQMFGTNKKVEKEGIVLDYGTFYLRVGRAGGANQKFKGAMKRIFDPHRRSIQTETLPEKQLQALMIQAYAEGNTYAWGYKEKHTDAEWIEGKMPAQVDEDGKLKDVLLDFSHANVIKLFTDLPDLFADVQEQCGKVSLFRDFIAEEDGKNS